MWGRRFRLPCWLCALSIAVAACFAQDPPKPDEQQELMQSLADVNNSPVDMIRVLEAFLKKHPQSLQRAEIERVLSKAALENKDDRRIVLYGERVLVATPDDMLLLDRVARSLLALGGRENAKMSLKYSRTFEENVNKLPAAEGKDAARRVEDRDRGLARALLYQARAKGMLGENEDAERLAAKSFSIYAEEDSAREWSDALARLGRNEDAAARMAEAFSIPDSRALDADRAADRRRLGELYRKLHGSEQGLGELILAAYDRTAALVENRKTRLREIEPNSVATDPMQFTLTGLDGKKLPLASLKGSVVVFDFWATWCQPCRKQHPMYEEVKKRFEGRKDVVFLSVDTDEDRSLVTPFLDSVKWSRTSVYFEDGLSRLLQISSIPTTILFDKEGRVASRMNGFVPERFVDLLAGRIQDVLAGQ
jgi:thiol-disulfide isomerase/thioredoxin